MRSIYRKNEMKIDVNHPTFIALIDTVINNITTNIFVKKYFVLNQEQKLTEQIKTFKIISNSIKSKIKLEEAEYKTFIMILLKRTEERELYETSELIKGVNTNFGVIYEGMKPVKKPTTRKIKTNNKNEQE